MKAKASATESLHSVQTLVKYLKNPDQLKTLDEFIATRRKDKAINTQITEAICTHFITALEKEDIEELSNALYKVPKTVEKIAERLLLAPQGLQGVDLSRQGTLLEQAAALVLTMIQNLRKGHQPAPDSILQRAGPAHRRRGGQGARAVAA